MPKTEDMYIFCHECNRGGNGSDKDKCSCGWRHKKTTSLGCYIGEKINNQGKGE